MKLFVDANVFLRFLLRDHKNQSPAAKKLFLNAKLGKNKLVTHSLVISEIIFILESYYRFSKKDIIKKIKIILLFDGLEILEKDTLIQAIFFYEKHNIDFVDAYVAAYSERNKLTVCSFDQDFNKIKEIKRISPTL